MGRCESWREALSARLDGEEDFAESAAVDAHLATCPDCRRWFEDAATVTRTARARLAAAPVDVTDAVLAAAPGPGRARLATVLRLLLGVLGLAQLALGLTQVVVMMSTGSEMPEGTILTGATAGHLWHESAAWNVGIGTGFLWVAIRRGRPGGVVAVLTAFVAMLVMLNLRDLTAGRVELTHSATHSAVLAGYLIVLVLTWPGLGLDHPPGGHGQIRWWRRRAQFRRLSRADEDATPPAPVAGRIHRLPPAAAEHRTAPRRAA